MGHLTYVVHVRHAHQSYGSGIKWPFSFSLHQVAMGVDTSALNIAFQTYMAGSAGLQLLPDRGAGSSRDSIRSLAQIPWNFSLSDLTAGLSNLADLSPLGNYLGSPFLHSDSDIY